MAEVRRLKQPPPCAEFETPIETCTRLLRELEDTFGPETTVVNCTICRQLLVVPGDWLRKTGLTKDQLRLLLPYGVDTVCGFADRLPYCTRCFAQVWSPCGSSTKSRCFENKLEYYRLVAEGGRENAIKVLEDG